MHEYSLINNLMNHIYSLASANKAKRVVGLKVRLGALSHMSSDHFREHFLIAAKGGLAEDARLDVTLETDKENPMAQDILLESLEVET